MTNRPKSFKVAEIAIDENGMWWFNYIGAQPEQGGLGYGWGSLGVEDERALSNVILATMQRERDEYLKKIKEKIVQKPST